MKKQNKIMIAVSRDEMERRKMIAKIAVNIGIATCLSDANKLIKPTLADIDLPMSYIVVCDNVNLRESPLSTHKLYELAAKGIAVIIGCKKVYPEHEFISEVFYPEDL